MGRCMHRPYSNVPITPISDPLYPRDICCIVRW